MVSMYRKVFRGKAAKVSFIILSVIAAVALYVNVNAATINWMPDSAARVIVSDNSHTPKTPEIIGQKRCVMQRIAVQGQPNLRDVCFHHGTNLSYGYYRNIYYQAVSVVKYKYDSKAYPVIGVGYADRTIIIPGTDTLLSFHYRSDSDQNFTFTIQKNVSRSLIKKQNSMGALEYYMLGDSNFKFMHNNPGYTWPVAAVNFSDNGKWIIAYVTNVGMLRFNLDTGEIVRFSHIDMPYHAPHSGLLLSLAVSNDGKYAALGGYGTNVPFRIYTIDKGCAQAFDNNWPNSSIPPMDNPCPSIELRQYTHMGVTGGYNYERNISFSSDGGMINFFADKGGSHTGEWVEVLSAGYERPRLDYLAIGDSYSSGEGDTQVVDGKKFYLPGTDVEGTSVIPREKCHISSRSYPFLLKDLMSISDSGMKSVACSGAEVEKDYIESENYLGQGDRLKILNTQSMDFYTKSSIQNFSSGRIQQVNFVKKYQPRAITITGSGNDVGFGGVIMNCLSGLATCSDAQSAEGKAKIGQEIIRQHDQLFNLYQAIKIVSPKTKIYAVGYPQFINEQSLFCSPNVQLDISERRLIVESVKYLNSIIEGAAMNAGVKYVDIEDSLFGHRLCEDGKSFVTGIALLGTSERQESFHPNHDGHRIMSKAISRALGSETLLNYTIHADQTDPQNKISVEIPIYFKSAMEKTSKKYKRAQLTETDRIKKTNPFNVSLDNMKPGSRVGVEIHSNPMWLGSYVVDDYGRLSVDVSIPSNVPAGFHTLHAIGQTYSGEEIDLWHIVEVQGRAGDMDEDGVSDDVDACMYVEAVGVDIDNDNIDDGCDAVINEVDEEKLIKTAVTVGVNAPKSVIQSTDDGNTVQSDRNSMDVQRQVEELLYMPDTPKYSATEVRNIADVKIFYALAGGIVLILVLLWVTTRYSTYKGM